MLYIKSERTPEKVELFIGNILVGKCLENDIISVNNEEQYQEFTNIESIKTYGLFSHCDIAKKLGKHEASFYKILFYKDTPDINMRPKSISTFSYFLPINDAKYQRINVYVHYKEKEEYFNWTSNLYLEYAYPILSYDFHTVIDGEEKVLKIDGGRIEKI